MSQTIYLAAPNNTRDTDRYESYFFLISHHFKDAELLEARELFPNATSWVKGWTAVLERIDVLVFIRDSQKAIGEGTYTEVKQAHKEGATVYMAATNEEGELVLTPWEELRFSLRHNKQRTYAIVKRICDRQPDAQLQEVSA